MHTRSLPLPRRAAAAIPAAGIPTVTALVVAGSFVDAAAGRGPADGVARIAGERGGFPLATWLFALALLAGVALAASLLAITTSVVLRPLGPGLGLLGLLQLPGTSPGDALARLPLIPGPLEAAALAAACLAAAAWRAKLLPVWAILFAGALPLLPLASSGVLCAAGAIEVVLSFYVAAELRDRATGRRSAGEFRPVEEVLRLVG